MKLTPAELERWKRVFKGTDPLLYRKWKKFFNDNPELWSLFKKFAYEAKTAGRERFSHWMIMNRIRWYTSVETKGSDFKISNDYIALYARQLVFTEPHFEGFFALKKMKSVRLSGPL